MLYEGKEGCPTLSFQDIFSNQKEIYMVVLNFLEKKMIKKCQGGQISSNLHTINHWLSNRFWFCEKEDGYVVRV